MEMKEGNFVMAYFETFQNMLKSNGSRWSLNHKRRSNHATSSKFPSS
jgi:hypothetical protein